MMMARARGDDADPSRIIYEDDHLVAVWHPGASDFALITFGDLIGLANGRAFFAKGPVVKLGWACLGFMAKSGNWYPPESVSAAIAQAAPYLAPFAERITYGTSMGAYAAIKFSARLEATAVLALCPQWSIDRAECDGHDPGWQRHFLPAMRGMGIVGADVAGQVALFSDHGDRRDRFHTEKIAALAPQVQVINVPSLGHHVSKAFAGTDNLQAMVHLLRSGDLAGLRQLGRMVRRRSPVRIRRLVAFVEKRGTPGLLRRLAGLPQLHPWVAEWNPELCWALVGLDAAAGQVERAAQGIAALAATEENPTRYVLAMSQAAEMQGRKVAITTHDGAWLVFDAYRGICQTTTGPLSALQHPVQLELDGDCARFVVTLGATRVYLQQTANRELAPRGEGSAEGATRFQVHWAKEGLAFARGDLFLSARTGGKLLVCGVSPRLWERFRLAVFP